MDSAILPPGPTFRRIIMFHHESPSTLAFPFTMYNLIILTLLFNVSAWIFCNYFIWDVGERWSRSLDHRSLL